jgi:uncharacterized membrane protein
MSTLASTLIERTLWYPTILGVLVVVAAVVLFVGSIYLMLGTNMGARLAFLTTFSGLMGLMVVLTALWITTASPLNTLRGSVPRWEIKEVVSDLGKARTEAVRNIQDEGIEVEPIEAANVKAAVDEGLVTKVDNAVEKFTPEDNQFALFGAVTDYLTTNTWEIGGSSPSWLDGQFTHTPKFAVVEFCGAAENTQPFGVAPDAPSCAAEGTANAKNNGFVVLEYNLGDVRLPPLIAFLSSVILFVLSLLMFGWYEKDKRAEAAARSESAKTPARTREPANA